MRWHTCIGPRQYDGGRQLYGIFLGSLMGITSADYGAPADATDQPLRRTSLASRMTKGGVKAAVVRSDFWVGPSNICR
jgi:hypothetical protein